jgi:hypothetical protein
MQDGGHADDDCLADAVVVHRFGTDDSRSVSLTRCNGTPNPDALIVLRELARPELASEDGAEGAPAPALNPELLVRLQLLASQFPGRPFEIVSGYRTRGRATSRHRSGDALDLRIEGIDNADLSAFARTLEATGVGYYPNSTFVHIDVRPSSAYWVDVSAPGKAPDYVRPAPDPRLASVLLADAAPENHGAELPVSDGDDTSDSDTHADADTDAEPQAAAAEDPSPAAEDPSRVAEDPSPAALEADLHRLAERALVVMRAAQSG